MKDEERKAKEPKKKESGGVAGGVLRGLGKVIPGLGDVVKGLEKSDAFKERLSIINKEVERQLKEAPLKRVERTTIPPRTTLENRRLSSKVESPHLRKQKEVIVDIFNEGDYIKIIAELPGVEEKNIKTKVKGNLLTISAKGTFKKYYKELILPCLVKEKIDSIYKNGILQIKAEKI
ncbi:MAG: Hsp20/alpha crystallin family protein [Candidatus Aerophobetes bacterium]|nr:Hsp20/alpha crystallin family protein [Candidatus Aerophobetes bacterium]